MRRHADQPPLVHLSQNWILDLDHSRCCSSQSDLEEPKMLIIGSASEHF